MIKKTLLRLTPALSLLLASAVNAQQYEQHTLTNDINTLVSKHQQSGASGGMLMAIEGKVLDTMYFGHRDAGKTQTISPNTVFDTGSLTKQFTAAAILKLQEQHKLRLTNTLGDYFPAAPKDKANITLHQLLTHSAGLQDYPGKGDFDLVATDAFFSRILALPAYFKPGVKYRYSNVGYSVLARIIELVSGQEYEQYLQANLFAPLGMFNTGYLTPQWHSLPHAEGYTAKKHFGTAVSRYQQMQDISWVLKGNGGINSTLTDFHLWMKSLRNQEILSQASLTQMTTAHIPEGPSGESHYGYGWVNMKTSRNTQLVTHNGSNGVFFADALWLKDEDAWVIFFSNSYSEEIMSFAWYAEAYLSKWLNAKKQLVKQ